MATSTYVHQMRNARHISSGAAAAVLSPRHRAFLGTFLCFLIVFDSAGASAIDPPVITSPLGAYGISGFFFSYQITATTDPIAFGATGLPSWLTIDTTTGLIDGTPLIPHRNPSRLA
jgi:hypothetical protein